MKTITCKEMGGMCDTALSANSYDEMMKVGWEHLEKAHPEMVTSINAMPKDDPKMIEWESGFKKTWADAKEV